MDTLKARLEELQRYLFDEESMNLSLLSNGDTVVITIPTIRQIAALRAFQNTISETINVLDKKDANVLADKLIDKVFGYKFDFKEGKVTEHEC